MAAETKIHIRHSDIDSMGIVHHSVYPLWFEAGRIGFLKGCGILSGMLNTLGLHIPLTELKCSYKRPVKYGDKIMVITRLIYLSYVKIKFGYLVIGKSDGKIRAAGSTTHAWTNGRLEPVNLLKASPEIFARLKQFAEPDK